MAIHHQPGAVGGGGLFYCTPGGSTILLGHRRKTTQPSLQLLSVVCETALPGLR